MSSATAKVSVCFFLLHVNQNKRAAYFLYAVSALLLLFAAATCILLFAQCSPVRALWTPALRHLCLPPNINANVGLAQSSMSTPQSTPSTSNKHSILLCRRRSIRRLPPLLPLETEDEPSDKDGSCWCPKPRSRVRYPLSLSVFPHSTSLLSPLSFSSISGKKD